MKIGVIADSHGNAKAARSALYVLKRSGAEVFIHLGDGIEDILEIESEAGLIIEKIPGNNDPHVNLDEERVFDWGVAKALVLHGHRQGINRYLGQLEYLEILGDLAWKARKAGADILLFGHTHAPEDLEIAGVRLLNPGALDFGTLNKTCLLIDISKEALKTTFIKIAEGVAENA